MVLNARIYEILGGPGSAHASGLRRLVVAAVLVGALALVPAALAFTIFRYSPIAPTNPGTSYQTSGFADRDHNRVCRETGGFGLARARYYAPPGSPGNLVADTGVVNTDCPGVLAALEGNGYYRSWCKHEGTVAWAIVCQTTKP